MEIYWILFALTIVGLLFSRRYGRNIENVLWLGIACLLIAVLGFRHEVGCDWYFYKSDLDSIPVQATTIVNYLRHRGFGFELGYALIVWTANQLNLGIYGVNFFCAIIFITGLVRFCRTQPVPWLALLLAIPYLVIVIAMGYTRQATALGVIFWSLSLLQENKTFASLFLIAGSAIFHKTSIFLLPLFAFFNTKILARKGLLLLFVLLTLALALAYHNYIFQQWETYVLRSSGGSSTGPIFSLYIECNTGSILSHPIPETRNHLFQPGNLGTRFIGVYSDVSSSSLVTGRC